MSSRNVEIEDNIQHMRRFALALTRDRDRADDLVQASIERALSKWHRRRPGLPLRPWLFAILRNLYISGHRRSLRLAGGAGAAGVDVETLADLGATPEGSVELQQVLGLLAQLPDEQRIAILLVAVEGFSYAEAAKIMKIPAGTLMSRLSRGREKLRALVNTPPAERLRRVR